MSNQVKYPANCMTCGKQFSQFHSEGHPDDGVLFACGLMVENMDAGITAFSCTYWAPVSAEAQKTVKDCATCEVVGICDGHITGGSWHHREGVKPCKPKIADIVVAS